MCHDTFVLACIVFCHVAYEYWNQHNEFGWEFGSAPWCMDEPGMILQLYYRNSASVYMSTGLMERPLHDCHHDGILSCRALDSELHD